MDGVALVKTALDDVAMKLLSFRPENRYQSAEELVLAVADIMLKKYPRLGGRELRDHEPYIWLQDLKQQTS